MLVSKPKHAGDRDPNKQENNIEYRIYYRNEYNRYKYKKRTFTNLLLGMEQNNKDTTETQGKTTPTT